MSKFIRNLALFVAGLPFATTKAAPPNQAPARDNDDKAVSLRPLNFEMDNLFASHRSHSSHSSHASHSSHYSGSGGYTAPTYVAPAPMTPRAPVPIPDRPSGVVLDSATVSGKNDVPATGPNQLTLSEKRRLQVLRVQMKLNSLRIYDGQLTGTLDEATRQSLKLFQAVKNLPTTGMMTTPTLNALGIPAVQ